MSDYWEVKRLEELADRMGFRIGRSKHQYDVVALFPKPDNFVCFNADIEVMYGSTDRLLTFLIGLEKGLQYAQLLRWDRKKAEARYLKEEAARQVVWEKKKLWSLLKGKSDDQAKLANQSFVKIVYGGA